MHNVIPDIPEEVFSYGFSYRKQSILRKFLKGKKVNVVGHGGKVPPGGTLILWGSTPEPQGLRGGVKILRAEDGFLRSVGLGADLVQPMSWVFDREGMYYDSSRPSDLENILLHSEFKAETLKRAASLIRTITQSGLTKYNVGSARWSRPKDAGRTILVPGQVEGDASIARGAPAVNTNINLLREVRKANPDAYIVYKPHPDVVAGLRARGQREDIAADFCNEVIIDVEMGGLLSAVDEVHVMTSLAGFEALLRRKRVVCYGQPFYAGWSLTTDIVPIARRGRRLTLEELVAGALIVYPAYIGRGDKGPLSPEEAMDELLLWKASSPGLKERVWSRIKRFVLSNFMERALL